MAVKDPPMVVDEPNAYYAVLGCHPKSSADELKRAYRRCVIESHPDKGGTPEKFQAVRMAAEVLCDESKRVEYDVRSRLAARMSQIEKDYERFKSTGGPETNNRRRASANARARAQWEREREQRERMTSEWNERAQSARQDQEQRWKKARARTAAFEEKWETAFKEFTAKREAAAAAAAAQQQQQNTSAGNTGRRKLPPTSSWGASGQRTTRPFSARGPRTPQQQTRARTTAWTSATAVETDSDDHRRHHQQQQPRSSQQCEGEGGRATVFTAHGRFECYHVDRLCKALLTACGTPTEHDFHFATRVERRKPCRFCCKDKATTTEGGGDGASGERTHVYGRSSTTASGTPRQRPKSALHEKLPRRNYGGSCGSSSSSPGVTRPTRPASAFAGTSASRMNAGSSPRPGSSSPSPTPTSTSSSSTSSSSDPTLRYAAPRGKLHHSSVDCPCLVGRAGVKELTPAELRGLRACGTCS